MTEDAAGAPGAVAPGAGGSLASQKGFDDPRELFGLVVVHHVATVLEPGFAQVAKRARAFGELLRRVAEISAPLRVAGVYPQHGAGDFTPARDRFLDAEQVRVGDLVTRIAA